MTLLKQGFQFFMGIYIVMIMVLAVLLVLRGIVATLLHKKGIIKNGSIAFIPLYGGYYLSTYVTSGNYGFIYTILSIATFLPFLIGGASRQSQVVLMLFGTVFYFTSILMNAYLISKAYFIYQSTKSDKLKKVVEAAKEVTSNAIDKVVNATTELIDSAKEVNNDTKKKRKRKRTKKSVEE